MNNFDEDYILTIINDDRLLENYLSNASIKEINIIYGTLYSVGRLNELVYKYPEIFDKFLNALEDKDLSLLFENIDYDEENNYFGEYLLNNLISRNKEYLIVDYFVKVIDSENEIDIYDFIDLMEKVNFYHESIIDYISNINLSKYPVLVDYINKIIESNELIELSKKIISDENLIKYVTTSNILDSYAWPWSDFESIDSDEVVKKICGYENIDDMYDNFKLADYDELRDLFLNEDDYNVYKNIIDKLSSNDIIRIIKLNFFAGINNNMNNILKDFLNRYVSFEKAIFLIDVLNLSDNDKISLINYVYSKNIVDINKTKDEIVNRNLNKILNFEYVDDEFKCLLPELINLSYNEEFFEAMTDICLNIDNIEYMQVFLSQLIKHVCIKRGLDVKDIEMNRCRNNEVAVWWEEDKRIQVYYDFLGTEMSFDMMDFFIESCFHELRHVYQDQKHLNNISLNSLMCLLEKILCIRDSEGYYKDNYSDVFIEVDARNYAVYDTFNYLKCIDRRFGDDDYSEHFHYLEELDKTKEFINDRKMAKSSKYFCNILNKFFELVPLDLIIYFRNEFKVLELITNEDGRPYSYEEIKERMHKIKNYSTNDIEYDKNIRNIWLFYKKYLHNLKYGLDNGIINIDFNSSQIKKALKK